MIFSGSIVDTGRLADGGDYISHVQNMISGTPYYFPYGTGNTFDQAVKDAVKRFNGATEGLDEDVVNYAMIADEALNSKQLGSMSFSDYYTWFTRSSKKMTDQGSLTPEAKKALHQVLTAWSSYTEDQQCSGVNRNLQVPPPPCRL